MENLSDTLENDPLRTGHLRVLIVEDSEDDALLLLYALKSAGFTPDVHIVMDRQTFNQALEKGEWDIVLSDYSMPSFTGLEALAILRARERDIPFILVSGNIGEETAVAAMKAGAHDYFTKGNLQRLGPAIRRELDEARIRKEARLSQKRLEASHRFYMGLLEDFPALVWRCDSTGSCNYFNQRWLTFRGRTLKQEQGDGWIDGLHEKDQKTCLAIFREALVLCRPFEMEFRLLRADGEYRWIQNVSRPFFDDNHNLGGYIGSCFDVTDHRQAEENLRLSEARYRTIFDASNDAICIHDFHTGKLVDANMKFYELVESLQPGLSSLNLPDLLRLVPSSRPFRQLEAASTIGQQVFEWQTKNQKGDPCWFEIGLKRALLGQDWRIVAVIRDVTDRKNAEAQFLQAQKMEAVGRLAGGVAHDFNNLLTVINGYSDLLLTTPEKVTPFIKELKEIRKAGERAAALTQQLLAFSRRQVLQLQPVNLSAVIREVDSMLRRLIGEDIQLLTHLDESLPYVNCDPGQLQQVLMNLAVNARDAMPEGGTLRIETQQVRMEDSFVTRFVTIPPGHYVILRVSDTGTGMDDETLQHLFEPFFTTKGKERGTGLGLSMVYGFVKQTGGEIVVESRLKHGSTFRIFLPPCEEKVETAREEAPPATAGLGHETVLVVEDDDGVRNLLKRFLEARGYQPMTVRNGQEALAVLSRKEKSPDLMITDLVMPGMSGIELAQVLRSSIPELKVLFISGYTEEFSGNKGIPPNMESCYLQKPFSSDELILKIREILDSFPETSPDSQPDSSLSDAPDTNL